MKLRALLPLFVGLLLIAAFVIGATIIESSNQLTPVAWMWAQRKLPMLWLVDAFALLALFPLFGIAALQNRLTGKAKEIVQMQDAHRDQAAKMQAAHREQMEQMLHNAAKSEQINARQAEQIAILQQNVEALAAKVGAIGTETALRHQAMEEEAARRHQALEDEALGIAAQAFSALMDRVEANTRQMEAVNLAVQYQRAEVKQLRQGLRDLQHSQETSQITRLTPAEFAVIAGQGMPGAPNTEAKNPEARNPQERRESNAATSSEARGIADKQNEADKNEADKQERREDRTHIFDTALVYGKPETSSPLTSSPLTSSPLQLRREGS